MANDRTEDGTAWADVQTIQLFPMWMGRKVSNCIVIWINKLQNVRPYS